MAEKFAVSRVLLFVSLVLLVFQSLTIQLAAQTDLGAIRVHVQDQSGSSLAGATVTVRNPATSWERTAQTDGSGDYSFVGVPLTGQYTVSVAAAQFKTAQQNDVQLRAGSIATLNFALNVSGEKAVIDVYGTPGSLPTESNQVSTRFDLQKIEDTPVLSNKVSSLPLLNSSVRPAQTTGDLFMNETLYVINGNGRRQTTYQLDDTDADDSWGRQTMFAAVPFPVVQEFTVYTNATSAEWGRNAGTAVNVVTKVGHQRLARRLPWHGPASRNAGQHAADHASGGQRHGAGQRNGIRTDRERQDVLPGFGSVQQSAACGRHHVSRDAGSGIRGQFQPVARPFQA